MCEPRKIEELNKEDMVNLTMAAEGRKNRPITKIALTFVGKIFFRIKKELFGKRNSCKLYE